MTHDADSAIEVTLLGGTSGPGRGEGDFFTMLQAALDGILEVCDADHGMVLFFAEGGYDPRSLVSSREGVARFDYAAASVLVQQAKISCKPVFEHPETTPASHREHPEFEMRRAALCVPIRQLGGALGVVHIERLGDAFSPETLSVVAWFTQMIETELRNRGQHRWRWRTVDVSRQLGDCVVA